MSLVVVLLCSVSCCEQEEEDVVEKVVVVVEVVEVVTCGLISGDSQPGRLIGFSYIIGHFTYILPALLLSDIVERQHLSVRAIDPRMLEIKTRHVQQTKQEHKFIKKYNNMSSYLLHVFTAAGGGVTQSSYLEDSDVREPVRTDSAPVQLDVLQPLDVRLRVAEHLALELHVAAHHGGAVGGQPGLQDGSVGGALCGTRGVRKINL